MFLHVVSEILRFVASALHDVLKKAPSETVLLDNYARVCIVLSEIINEVGAPALAIIPCACQASLSSSPLVWRLTNLHAACKIVQGAKEVESSFMYACRSILSRAVAKRCSRLPNQLALGTAAGHPGDC